MLRLAFLALVFLSWPQAPSRAADTRPPVTHQSGKAGDQSKSSDNATKPTVASAPLNGSNKVSPLYVHAECEHGCGYSEDHRGFWERLWTDPVGLFTAVLAIVTVFLFVIALFQIKYLLKADKRASTAEKIATAQNVLIEKQAKISEDQLKLSVIAQQPVVHPTTNAAIEVDPGARVVNASFNIEVKNTGLTLARNVRFWTNTAWRAGEIGPDFDFPEFEGPIIDNSRIPANRSILSGRIPIPREALVGTVRQAGIYYVWGRCDWDDVFPDTPRHWISWCFQLEVVFDVFTIPFDVIQCCPPPAPLPVRRSNSE